MSDGPRVLVAHYDTAQAESMAAALNEAGAQVRTVTNGDAALVEAQEGSFRLAFVSTLLPGTHGFEVCRQISAALPTGEAGGSAAVILLTDVEDPYVRARARHVGAKQVVIEPLSADALQSLLDVDWQGIDPLELPGDGEEPRRGGDLMQELMGQAGAGGESDDLLGQLADPLTGLANESYTLLKLDEEAKRSSRHGQDLSLVLAQIDNWSELCEASESGGDEAALDVASVFLCESRDIDVAGRLGQQRFLLVLPNTPADGAQVVASRFREALADRSLELEDGSVAIEVSLGVATMGTGTEAPSRDRILELAENDRQMGSASRRS